MGIHHALRSLRRGWGFAVLFVFTLALGLAGVNTIFSVLDTVILRPLPFKHADRLVTITETVPFMGNGPQICTIDEFQRWQKSGLLDYAAAVNTMDLILPGRDRAELLFGARVTPDFFRVFGIAPFLGRGFLPEDAAPGHEQVIILSHELWARRFGSDPAMVGKSIQFSGATMTVIGVAPPRFDFPLLADVGVVMRFAPEQTEFWMPLVITEKMIDQNNDSYYVIGRLRAGIPVINQKMAHLLWPGENLIGREFTDNGNPPILVIGVVGNVHSGPLETEPMMQYYWLHFLTTQTASPSVQKPIRSAFFVPSKERSGVSIQTWQSRAPKRWNTSSSRQRWSAASKPIFCLDSRRLLCSFPRLVSSEWHRFQSHGIRASSASGWRSAQQSSMCSGSKYFAMS